MFILRILVLKKGNGIETKDSSGARSGEADSLTTRLPRHMKCSNSGQWVI